MSKPVFVDKLRDFGWRYGPSCHLMPADGSPEAMSALHSVATEVGLKSAWFQSTARWPHYDLTGSKRAAAMRVGAVQICTGAYLRMRRIQMRGWFVEPGCGLKMLLGCWYMLSDSGSYYSQRGFRDPKRAVTAALGLRGYGLAPGDTGVCHPAKADDLGMANLCNVVKADDLLTFWALTEPDLLRGK